MADEIPDDEFVDGELVGPDIPAEPSYDPETPEPRYRGYPGVPGVDDDPFGMLLRTPPFGALLKLIRNRIAEARGQRELTQTEFGKLIEADQVTISRWETGRQDPQRAQLAKIARVAQEHGLKGITAARLDESLKRDVETYSALDPRLARLDTLLRMEDANFVDRFFEITLAVYHILRSARHPDAE